MNDHVANTGGPGVPRLIELAAAFGQGAGTMLLETEAADALSSQYGQAVNDYAADEWSRDRLRAVEWARALGRLAAAAAVARGGVVITGEDAHKAMTIVNRERHFPFGPCPFCRR